MEKMHEDTLAKTRLIAERESQLDKLRLELDDIRKLNQNLTDELSQSAQLNKKLQSRLEMLQNETSQRHMHHEKELSQQTMVLEAEKRDLAEKIASLEKTITTQKATIVRCYSRTQL
jgi:chromosome segregation ATPase